MSFDEDGLVELLAKKGADEAVDALPSGIKKDKDATAETIENNVRKLITDEQPINPKYYDRMSELLDALIEKRRKEALDYKEYLEELQALAKKLVQPEEEGAYPDEITSPAQRALYDNLGEDAVLALELDGAIRDVHRDDWRGNLMKEREILKAIKRVLASAETNGSVAEAADILDLAKQQHEY
jgi:type I restriction enzyme R subunit